ncbi:adenosylcobinamide-GDP ribazoletransferase [Streptomyces gamaensis]|uniref:Adenosylcobinamide-GDP ribazoletransferase n=1 Tax=Streptomyces gamaensis TaxID=1763542 RepID=A0ABW0Z9L2_9ACTN
MSDTPAAAPAPVPSVSPGDALRFAFGTLTVLPVRVSRWDRAAARGGMAVAPVAGVVVGAGAAGAGAVLLLLGSGPLLAAVAAVALPAVLTRALHLDGLADVADGLGSGKPAEDALRIMKQSDIGPFGVVTLLLALLAQVAAYARLFGERPALGALAALVAGVTARAGMALASRTGVPPARPGGLGAAVAEVLPRGRAFAVASLSVVVCAAAGAATGPYGALRAGLAAVAALLAGEVLLRRCVRRFGGVTGDVFGAVAETTATAALVALTLG